GARARVRDRLLRLRRARPDDRAHGHLLLGVLALRGAELGRAADLPAQARRARDAGAAREGARVPARVLLRGATRLHRPLDAVRRAYLPSTLAGMGAQRAGRALHHAGDRLRGALPD